MRKVIAIGESAYDIVFGNDMPKKGYPGGRILNAAASLAKTGVPTTFVSECGNDYFGNLIVKFLADCGVATTSIDRFTEGTTRCVITCEDDMIAYGSYPPDRFSVVWPRIDENDIILIGSRYAVDEPQRERLFELVRYAKERKAIVVYLPGFYHKPEFGITKVMTAILENLEISDVVIANGDDIRHIYNSSSHSTVYSDKIKFYCPNFVYIEEGIGATVYASAGSREVALPHADETTSLGWRARFIAGVVYALATGELCATGMPQASAADIAALVEKGVEFASSAPVDTNVVTDDFASQKSVK